MDVSICAVTFRRPRGLSRLLDSLARLKLPEGLRAEVVLVDNDPDGSAFRDPERPEQCGALPVRWYHETRGDIAHARNRCVDEARGSWVAFVDDDEAVHEGWIAAYDWLSEQVEADGFFGPVLPRLEVERSHWIDLPGFYARPRRPTGTWMRANGLCTANAFVRRALLREVRFDPAFGRTLGEDTDCFQRARDGGARFVWCDEACVDEFIPPERHRAGYLCRRALESGAAWSHLERRRSARPLALELALALARLVATLPLLPLAALRGRREAFRTWLRVCTRAGRIHGLLGGRLERRGP